ncbi:small ribosomal subunit protein bS6c alpha [Rhododendron vialii]|uniref:small ribosomal subunit protein bS6c alpha n=1 Tax=Rhododendron vialii TaxID=182163 RepID=UPI00265DBD6A|nr:small ribosomal subunit protein bS6c alpha [Rhododendron vialii]
MASTSIALTLTSPSSSTPLLRPPLPTISFTRTSFRTFPHHHIRITPTRSTKAQAFDFSSTFFEQGFGGGDDDDNDEDPTNTIGSILMGIDDEEKEEPQCPPGLRQYETMAVLRPDMSEEDRLSLTQKYEELLVAGGGMYVDVFNRGVIPLAYPIKRKNKDGVVNTYLDGIYLLFTYFTKPESMPVLEETLQTDDSVIRFSSFKVRKRKY